MLLLKNLRKLNNSLNLRSWSSTAALNNSIFQTRKSVNPFSNIEIQTTTNLKIIPYNVFECPDSNLMRITFNTNADKLKTDNFKLEVVGNKVTISDDFEQQSVECVLEIPIKSNLQIKADKTVTISELYSDQIHVRCSKDIKTKNLRSTSIDLRSERGKIQMKGITLAANISLQTQEKGDVSLDKLQGDLISVKTENGTISTNSCYITNSKFETQAGKINLKNMHKNCVIIMHGDADFIMNGFHGNLNATTNSKLIDIQLSEICGSNQIVAKNAKTFHLNISDNVQENSLVNVESDYFTFDESLTELRQNVNGRKMSYGSKDAPNIINIETGGEIIFKKMSWADSFKFKVAN